MDFAPVSTQEMQAAQVLTGLGMAAWILAGFIPGRARQLRLATVTLYLAGVAAFVIYLVVK
jgi:hypothetical protein